MEVAGGENPCGGFVGLAWGPSAGGRIKGDFERGPLGG